MKEQKVATGDNPDDSQELTAQEERLRDMLMSMPPMPPGAPQGGRHGGKKNPVSDDED